MTKMGIRIADTVKRLSRTGYTIKAQNRTSKQNQNKIISAYQVDQLVKSLMDQANKILRHGLIQPKNSKVTIISDIEYYEEDKIDPVDEAFGDKTRTTAYLTFNAEISSRVIRRNVILNDFASAVFSFITKEITPGKGQGISVSVNFDESRRSTMNVGIMFERLS
jgi:hypothetical protein